MSLPTATPTTPQARRRAVEGSGIAFAVPDRVATKRLVGPPPFATVNVSSLRPETNPSTMEKLCRDSKDRLL
jgi:hypothetical protein